MEYNLRLENINNMIDSIRDTLIGKPIDFADNDRYYDGYKSLNIKVFHTDELRVGYKIEGYDTFNLFEELQFDFSAVTNWSQLTHIHKLSESIIIKESDCGDLSALIAAESAYEQAWTNVAEVMTDPDIVAMRDNWLNYRPDYNSFQLFKFKRERILKYLKTGDHSAALKEVTHLEDSEYIQKVDDLLRELEIAKDKFDDMVFDVTSSSGYVTEIYKNNGANYAYDEISDSFTKDQNNNLVGLGYISYQDFNASRKIQEENEDSLISAGLSVLKGAASGVFKPLLGSDLLDRMVKFDNALGNIVSQNADTTVDMVLTQIVENHLDQDIQGISASLNETGFIVY